MGNTFGSAATLGVTFDQTTIIPGTTVTGKVYLAVIKEKVDAESLIFHLKGGEYTKIRYTTGSGKNRSTHVRYAQSIFLDLAIPLTVVNEGFFSKGQYEFPFSFVLPLGVLPTMAARLGGDHGGACRVTYDVEAKLHRKGMFTWDIQCQQELIVLGTPVEHVPKYVSYLPPEEYPLTFMCCFDRGHVRAGLSTESSVLGAGDSFDINYVLQNNSTSRIKAIELEVFEAVKWSVRGYTRTNCTQLFYKRLNENEMQFDVTPLTTAPSTKPGTFEITNTEVLAQLKEILDSRRYHYPAQIPTTTRASMEGQLISVKHYISLRIATPFGTSDPVISFNITVHRYGISAVPLLEREDEDGKTGPTALPADWHPVVASPVVLPSPPFVEAKVMEGDENYPQVQVQEYRPAPSAPPSYDGFFNLMMILKHTYDQKGEFIKWCQQNDLDRLTPEEFGQLFEVIRNLLDQVAVADMLVEIRTSITCAHIAASVKNCQPPVKVDIARKFSTKCSDKANVNALKDFLTPFEFMCIESYFR